MPGGSGAPPLRAGGVRAAIATTAQRLAPGIRGAAVVVKALQLWLGQTKKTARRIVLDNSAMPQQV